MKQGVRRSWPSINFIRAAIAMIDWEAKPVTRSSSVLRDIAHDTAEAYRPLITFNSGTLRRAFAIQKSKEKPANQWPAPGIDTNR
jgi:hypothetical protein